VDLLAD